MVVDASSENQESRASVLCSGGLDSAVLLMQQAQHSTVQPVYVSAGLAWEPVERKYLDRLLAVIAPMNRIKPCVDLECSVADIYPSSHWALSGNPPAYNTRDEEVYLLGRNVILLSKAAVYSAYHGIGRLAVGPLAGNPFPDATPEFFEQMGRALSTGLEQPIAILAPFSTLGKVDVIRMGAALGVPWEHTLSCMNPAAGSHCGRCSKCRERLQAFAAAGLADPAAYAFRPVDVATGL